MLVISAIPYFSAVSLALVLLKKAVVESVRTAALLHTTSMQISLPSAVRKSILLLLSIGPETQDIICDWLLQGCQTALYDVAAPCSGSLATPRPTDPPVAQFDYRALIRSICESNRFMSELCKYLSAESKNFESLLRSVLHSVISRSAALASLVTFVPPLFSMDLCPRSPPTNAHLRFVKENPAEPCIPELLLSIFSSFKVSDDGLVHLLPHALASEVETLTVITEQCIHTSLKGHAALETNVGDSDSAPVDPLFLEVDAKDYLNKWYKAVVVEGSLHGDDFVKVHFVGCTLPSHCFSLAQSPARVSDITL